jgi:para-nitrobenzyl esterase
MRTMLTVFIAMTCQLAAAASAPVPTHIVTTETGRVQGLLDHGVSAFKGIPYAKPPIGELRFMAPEPIEAWDSVLDATDYGASAMQMYNRGGDTDLSRQIATVFTTESEKKSDNEDSLFLNVWTPAPDDRKRPVMVWFHGGGWAYGSGSWPVYDGTNLANKGDVVVVTVNHRLNVFGYLNLANIGGEKYQHSGNAGLLDMVSALEWVRDNIDAFGGDADNVTIMGESGGGSKVSHLMATPAADGLFHKAVIQSGPALTAISAEDATANAEAILAELGIDRDNLERLQWMTADSIIEATEAAAAKQNGRMRLAPVVDGITLPRDPFTPDAPKQSADIPVLIGWNKDEMTIFNAGAPWFGRLTEDQMKQRLGGLFGEKSADIVAAYQEAYPNYSPTYLFNMITGDSRMALGSVTLADRKAKQKAPVFMYYLVWETPVGDGVFKSPHTLDMPFMFNNVDKSVAITGESTEARILENQMSSSWIAFARTGNPSNPSVGSWTPYTAKQRATMVFDVKPRIENDPKGELLKLMAR